MLIAIIIIIGVLLAAVLGVLIWAHHEVFGPPAKGDTETTVPLYLSSKSFMERIKRATLALAEKPCEIVYTRARDRIRLGGRYYHTADGAPLCICFHGYRGSGVRDFSMMAPLLAERGYNILLVDQRAHWRSGSRTITFGIKERYDVLAWIRYANERFGADTPIYLFGISLGGGTVLMASGLDLPDNVRAICADCPLNSPKEVICYIADRTGKPSKWTWPFVWLAALVIGRFHINAASAEKAVKRTSKPILIIHGEEDDFVPGYMSREVYEANPAMIEYHTFPKAEHAMSYMCDPERYKRIVNDFLSRHP